MGKLTGMAGDQLSLCAQRLQGPSLRLCLVLGHVCPRNVSSRANLKRALSRHLWGFQPCPASHGSRIKRVPLKAGPGDGVLPLGHPEKRQLERAAGIWSRAASCPWLSHFYTQHQNILSCWHPAADRHLGCSLLWVVVDSTAVKMHTHFCVAVHLHFSWADP